MLGGAGKRNGNVPKERKGDSHEHDRRDENSSNGKAPRVLGGVGAAALGASALGLGLLGGCAPQPRAAEDGSGTAAPGDAASPALSQTGSAASPYAQINPQDWDFTTNSIEDFANTTMFSELKIGSLTLKNRLIKLAASSMVPNEEQKAVAYHGRIAAGGMGTVLVEGSYIMLERLDKRVNVADNDSRMTIEESPLVAICQALDAAGADALELRLGTFAFHEAQFVNDGVFAGYGYDGATSFGTFFDFDSHFSGLLDGSHSGCGLIMGACRYVKQHGSIPVGGVVFMDPALAPDYFENALKEGWLDMIYMHRPVANCDAEYANKLRENRIDEIRPCCRCLNCLGGLCRVNPCNIRCSPTPCPRATRCAQPTATRTSWSSAAALPAWRRRAWPPSAGTTSPCTRRTVWAAFWTSPKW